LAIQGETLATQLMIYETAVPVSHARHGNWSVEVGADYAFCRTVNSVPLMAAEFASAALEYAVVFGATGDAVMPITVLGVRTNENLYVTKEGGWQAKYIPAFVRRYPFVFLNRDDGKTFTLCIDEAFQGFNQSGRGQRLFGDDGKPTPYVENVLKFLGQYQREFQRTQTFCKKLKDLNLLEPMQAQIKFGSGQRMALGGFSVVDRARLKTLSGNVLAQLVQSEELELIYAHLVSMRNFATVRDRLAEAPPAHSAGDGPLPH
jgi:SapC